MSEKLLDDLFPLPKGRKLRMPRFGQSQPPASQPLPAVGQRCDVSTPGMFALDYAVDNVQVRVREHAGEEDIRVYISCPDPGRLGQQVSVMLVGRDESQILYLKIPLDTPEKVGCSGTARAGSVSEVRKQVGAECTVLACLPA